MAEVMAQSALELPPSSRQDIISAILDDYGSYGGDETSPYVYSPAFKELPLPPPVERTRKISNDKLLASAGLMNMRFQLRVDEPTSPDSPDGSRSSLESAPTKITSRIGLRRTSKPASLKLTKSNGATAKLPSTPSQPFKTPIVPSSKSKQEEEKSLPPPPPEKSTRRQPPPPPPAREQKAVERPPRKDLLQTQDGKKSAAVPMAPVQRKPVPKFTSLADLGNGPRGGKGGPLPQPRSSKQSVEAEGAPASSVRPATAVEVKTDNPFERPAQSAMRSKSEEKAVQRDKPPVVNPLPPTPTPEEDTPPPPPPPSKKPFAGMGLPSNPRAKAPDTPKHTKGKSSTGFDWTSGPKSASATTPAPNTITPGPTPSPNGIERAKKTQNNPPVSPPKVNDTDQRRPFSFDPPPQPPPKQQTPVPTTAAAPPPPPPAKPCASASPAAPPAFVPPPRTTSRAPPIFASLPSQQRSTTPPSPTPEEPSPAPAAAPSIPTTPSFTPLTVKPISGAAPPLTSHHLNCYSHHSSFVWSKNMYQPLACMVCSSTERERMWACVWCYLRICVDCSQDLVKLPGRDVRALAAKKGVDVDALMQGRGECTTTRSAKAETKRHDSGTGENPSVVVWGTDFDDDFS